MRISGEGRNFLLLQGPHGPFFNRLGHMLRQTGAHVWRVGFNKGDAVFWRDKAHYIPFTDPPEHWPDRFQTLLKDHQITDIVLYGDIRPLHAQAVEIARAAGVTVHVFEEGYLRPYWVTYERDGSNGHSALMNLTIRDMRRALRKSELELPDPPAHWGDMRHHIFYGAVYHFCVLALNRRYRHFRSHRALGVAREFALYLKRLWAMPLTSLQRRIASWRIRNGGFPYHLVLLQLEHDSSFQAHSPFSTMPEFLELVFEGFAKGAPRHHHLVIKAHPLEDGRAPLQASITRLAEAYGLKGRLHFVRGGKLASLLNHARSAVTVNSTAAQQVLWRGMPLKIFGRAVYDKPEFVSDQDIEAFFAHPARPDARAYRDYRRFLLETSQVPGGYYSLRGRRQLMRHVVDLMLAPDDPYTALIRGDAAPRQQVRKVK
ncbi:capsule biosynthesis protein [Roseinatronobacter alkalisoli]|uniref:Capsular biosynthesis protein n=1 Tax=Roseinatronobacter alkalisoli TaxID=3028235 RepID=A0ABT5TCD0_9RHOB|nr:capsular biosynthesis protein [Roseinatronobacter sp. HJB301]MDD7972651.1 capsular biosynthesis protein [Roseinatronobacter sp. HJB301]